MIRRLLKSIYFEGLGVMPPMSPDGEGLPMPPLGAAWPPIPMLLLLFMRASRLASLAAFFSALAATRSSAVMPLPAVGEGLTLFLLLVVPRVAVACGSAGDCATRSPRR